MCSSVSELILFLCGEGCACKQTTTTEKAKEKKNEKKIMKLKSNQMSGQS